LEGAGELAGRVGDEEEHRCRGDYKDQESRDAPWAARFLSPAKGAFGKKPGQKKTRQPEEKSCFSDPKCRGGNVKE
jgi:hypothetical protein